ncbi:MAG: hypothetical protein JKY96_07895 [Phycisphaerales bacterium]|nr:hypothetical protein [Phycisphaerales bacterium]
MTHDQSTDLQNRLDFAIKAAKASSKITLEYFQNPDLSADHKADGSPVTIADRATETDLRKRIIERYPDDSILGEELDDRDGTTGYQWIIDPIDGTISFVHGIPLYGTMLACLKDDQPILGVITMPALNSETIYAARGLGAFHQIDDEPPTRAHTTSTSNLADAMVSSTSMAYYETPEQRSIYTDLLDAAHDLRGWPDCYAIVLLVTARIDAVVEPYMMIWDIAAPSIIIEEAGGDWTAFSGVKSLAEGTMIATNGQLHEQIIRIVR